ncbi:Simple sugar transport system ATP-binding protein OS=Castellaniella defragrans OX=75697 GN=HNR28_002644 PE=4 SV=1 [Castellaniella defragrans]
MSPILEVSEITKSFPGVKALDGVSLALESGQVHALVGENGAGKSTLIALLTGVNRPDGGSIRLRGQQVSFASPISARRGGIAAIYQELSIVPWMSVAENIVLGNEPGKRRFTQIVARSVADETARRALARLDAADIDIRAQASRLSTGQKQLVEIARILALDAQVIIMDEPTSSLPKREAERLLKIIAQLKADGKAILFVSHRLDEVAEIADVVTVLRGGRKVLTARIDEIDRHQLIGAMIGHEIGEQYPPRVELQKTPLLRVEGLTRRDLFKNVSFELQRGEILGFYGLIGAGRTEVMRAIAGADPIDAGTIRLGGKNLAPGSVATMIASGIVYLPEDRKDQGLALHMSVRENIVLSILDRLSSYGVIRSRQVDTLTAELVEKVKVRGVLSGAVVNLSGGNQQKVIIARGLASGADVLIFDEPTRGIDVGAKYEIYCLIQELARDGAGVILVSSELPEIINVSDRAVVMSNGSIYGEFDHTEFDERIMLTAAFEGLRASQEQVVMS